MPNLPIDPDGSAAVEARSSLSISHLIHTLQRYRYVIGLAMAGVAIGCAILATAVYLLAPFQRVKSQPFGLEFKGATVGESPNGVKFSAAEIASPPILLKVYRGNELAPFVPFDDFRRAILILQANAPLENLAADYQSQLADPRLTAVDRDRIRREWQARSDALDKNSYAIDYIVTQKSGVVPPTLGQKTLLDVLSTWAAYVINEQHLGQYQRAGLTPGMMDARPAERAAYTRGRPGQTPGAALSGSGETVMPQLSDSLLDRLVALSAESNDVKYRQKMIDDFRRLAARAIPAEDAVAYDQQLLRDPKGDGPPALKASAATITAELDGARAEAKRLTGEVNEVYVTVSRNLNPSTELYTLTSPSMSRTERALSLPRLGLYGLLLLLLALPITVLICLAHNYVREEDAIEAGLPGSRGCALAGRRRGQRPTGGLAPRQRRDDHDRPTIAWPRRPRHRGGGDRLVG